MNEVEKNRYGVIRIQTDVAKTRLRIGVRANAVTADKLEVMAIGIVVAVEIPEKSAHSIVVAIDRFVRIVLVKIIERSSGLRRANIQKIKPLSGSS